MEESNKNDKRIVFWKNRRKKRKKRMKRNNKQTQKLQEQNKQHQQQGKLYEEKAKLIEIQNSRIKKIGRGTSEKNIYIYTYKYLNT